jgi:hypothetical protein
MSAAFYPAILSLTTKHVGHKYVGHKPVGHKHVIYNDRENADVFATGDKRGVLLKFLRTLPYQISDDNSSIE